MNETLVKAVLSHAESIGNKPAIILKEKQLTYHELATQIKTCAAILKEHYGIRAGDKVMINGLSKPEFFVVFLGTQYLHATTIPLDKAWMEDTVLKLYDFIKPQLVISDMAFHRADVRSISLRMLYQNILDTPQAGSIPYTVPDMSCVAEMLFTTGTTGTPKGAMLSYKNILSITENNITGVGIRPEDVVLDALPLCHSLGLREARMTLSVGATLVIQNGFTFPKELRMNVEKFGCTGFVCVPAIMEQLIRSVEGFEELFGHFRYMEIGAGSLSYDLKRKLPQLLPNTDIFNAWGSSETGGVIFLDVKRRQDKIAALGIPVPSAKIKVIDEGGQTIRATSIDNAGRLAVFGDMTMCGYCNMPEVNKETLVDGWLVTNDLVYTDDEGFIYMLGRADDIINVGGEKVSPIEIENTATEFPAVRDAACIGVRDEIMGQVPVLLVAADEPYREEDLLHFLSGKLERFKLPKQTLRVNDIPRNRMKKLDRKAVRRLWEEKNLAAGKDNEFIQTILSRHSVRHFTEKRIERTALETLIKAGIQAPTGHNLQTWRFTVVRSKESIARIRETASTISKREKTPFFGFYNPDTLIIVSYDERNDTGLQDACCAAENILLAAHSMGLGGCWLNSLTRICSQPEVREMLGEMNIPATHKICSLIALGYPANRDKAPVRKTDVVQWIE